MSAKDKVSVATNPFEPEVKAKGPRRKALINEYMLLFYQTLMKEEAERRIIVANEKYDALSDEQKKK